jgi:hypothetical protein
MRANVWTNVLPQFFRAEDSSGGWCHKDGTRLDMPKKTPEQTAPYPRGQCNILHDHSSENLNYLIAFRQRDNKQTPEGTDALGEVNARSACQEGSLSHLQEPRE